MSNAKLLTEKRQTTAIAKQANASVGCAKHLKEVAVAKVWKSVRNEPENVRRAEVQPSHDQQLDHRKVTE